MKVKYLKARQDFRDVVQDVLDDHTASLAANQSNGHSEPRNGVPSVKSRGVESGSFVDLLVQGGAKESGEEFSSNVKAQQVLWPEFWQTRRLSKVLLYFVQCLPS